jgi:flagellar motor switch protein FliN/FliY
MATITLEGALDGTMCMIFETGTAAMLADLMLMGDGTAEYNDDHKDAIGELINQMMGSYTTAMGEKLGGSVSTGAIQVQEFDFSKPPVSLQGGDMALLKVKVDGQSDSVIGVFIPGALSDVLMENFVAGPAEDASGLEGHEKGVGLSGAELDELSQVATDFSDGSGGNSGFSKGSGSFSGSGNKSVEMLLDVELDVSIELGRTNLSIKRVLELSAGSIVELDRMAGEPVDLLVNDKVVAKGEVVVVDENFGIRIVSLVSPEERIKSLK